MDYIDDCLSSEDNFDIAVRFGLETYIQLLTLDSDDFFHLAFSHISNTAVGAYLL